MVTRAPLPRELATLAATPTLKWHSAKPGEIPLWLADMDFGVAPAIRETIVRHAMQGALSYGGDLAAAETALLAWIARRHGLHVEAGHVRWFTGVTQGAAAAVHALTRPNDCVAICTPTYPPLARAVREAGRRLVSWPMVSRDGAYRPDIDALQRIVDQDAPALLLLSNPHNPTGRAFTAAECRAMAETLVRSGTLVLSDEIFADIVFPGHTHTPFAAAVPPELAARTLTLWSASKAFNIAGLRCAALLCGSRELGDKIGAVSPCLLGAPGILAVAASIAAWTEGELWLEQTLRLLAANRDRLFDAFETRLPLLRGARPDGTFMAWFDARRLRSEDDLQPFLLQRTGIDVGAGPAFGPEGAGCFRIAFATPAPVLDYCIDAIVAAFAGDPP